MNQYTYISPHTFYQVIPRRGGWTGLLGKGDSARGQGASPGRCPPDGSRAKPSLPVPWLGLSPLRQGPKETCRAYHLLRYTMLHKIFIRTSIQVRRHTSSIGPAEKLETHPRPSLALHAFHESRLLRRPRSTKVVFSASNLGHSHGLRNLFEGFLAELCYRTQS